MKHLSQAVETLALQRPVRTALMPLNPPLTGEVKLQWFEVTVPELDHFEDISNALAQLDRRTYGRCKGCGKRIEPEILKDRPWAAFCCECDFRRAQ